MRIGVTLRSMGPQSTAELALRCAQIAEQHGIDSLWVADHIAIPPDDAEGSEGRYLDPLTFLAWLAAHTQRIALGTGVLILPYRPALPTAKAIATVQELSGGRLHLGVGIGWMKAEFRALGLSRRHRVRDSETTMKFIRECFAQPVVESNGQPFIFSPRPPRPPIYMGGAAPHATNRALELADGWMPMGMQPDALAAPLLDYRRRAVALGVARSDVVVMAGAALGADSTLEQAHAYQRLGVTEWVVPVRYDSAEQYAAQVERIANMRERMAASG